MNLGGPKWRYGCLGFLALLLVIPLGFCGYVRWHEPQNALPAEVEWTDVLAFGSAFNLREGCSFGVYRISDHLRNRLIFKGKMPSAWLKTPIALRDRQYLRWDAAGGEIPLYALHATSCASDTARRFRLVEAYGVALEQPGNWVKILNHGEGMVIVAPRQGLAWFLAFG